MRAMNVSLLESQNYKRAYDSALTTAVSALLNSERKVNLLSDPGCNDVII